MQIINEINSISGNIAAAVEEQTATTNEISKNVGDAARGADEVSRNVQQAAAGRQRGVHATCRRRCKGVNDIAKNINQLAGGANDVARNAGEAAKGMNDVAKNVRRGERARPGTPPGAPATPTPPPRNWPGWPRSCRAPCASSRSSGSYRREPGRPGFPPGRKDPIMAYTSFFRDADALSAIGDIVIPALAHWRAIRVWDAGCATGEEPYTLAILFASKLRPFPFRNLDILATDYEESSYRPVRRADRQRPVQPQGHLLGAPGAPGRSISCPPRTPRCSSWPRNCGSGSATSSTTC